MSATERSATSLLYREEQLVISHDCYFTSLGIADVTVVDTMRKVRVVVSAALKEEKGWEPR